MFITHFVYAIVCDMIYPCGAQHHFTKCICQICFKHKNAQNKIKCHAMSIFSSCLLRALFMQQLARYYSVLRQSVIFHNLRLHKGFWKLWHRMQISKGGYLQCVLYCLYDTMRRVLLCSQLASGTRNRFNRNAITCWALLSPETNPVIYTNTAKHAWLILGAFTQALVSGGTFCKLFFCFRTQNTVLKNRHLCVCHWNMATFAM